MSIEKQIHYTEDTAPEGTKPEWKHGTLLGFGVDYEVQENGLGIACGPVTRAIVRTRQGEFKLLDLKQIREE